MVLSLLFSARKCAASLALCSIALAGLVPLAQSHGITSVSSVSAPTVTAADIDTTQTIQFTPEPVQIAHHGGEGSAPGAAAGVASGAQVMALKGRVSSTSAVSDSLWTNLLLPIALQHDAKIRHYAKNAGRVNTMTLISIAGVSALGITQSVLAMNQTESQTLHVVNHGHGDHVHTEPLSRVPAGLGIASGAMTLATLGWKAAMDHHYGKRITDRQLVIKNQLETLVQQLKAGEPFSSVSPELVKLVGETATAEFEELWANTHPNSIGAKAKPDASAAKDKEIVEIVQK